MLPDIDILFQKAKIGRHRSIYSHSLLSSLSLFIFTASFLLFLAPELFKIEFSTTDSFLIGFVAFISSFSHTLLLTASHTAVQTCSILYQVEGIRERQGMIVSLAT